MLNEHRPNILQICAKTQPTATVTLHIIAKNVPEINMTLNCAYMPCRYISQCAYLGVGYKDIYHL